jgi:hypothetical protein
MSQKEDDNTPTIEELQTELAVRMSLRDGPDISATNGDERLSTATPDASTTILPPGENTGFLTELVESFGQTAALEELFTFLADPNVADSLRRADSLYMQRYGYPVVVCHTSSFSSWG